MQPSGASGGGSAEGSSGAGRSSGATDRKDRKERKEGRGSAEEASSGKTRTSAPPSGGVAGSAVGVAVISSFLFGYSICVLDSCGELIPVVFGWCNSDWRSDCLASRVCQGLVNSSVYLGAAAGALLAGRPRLTAAGSRLQMCLSDVLFIAGGILGACAQGVHSLLLGRLISGVGLGVCAIAGPLYIAEVSPRERRGSNSALHGAFIAVGIFASITFGLPQSPPPRGPDEPLSGLDVWFWRLLLGFPVLPALLQMALFRWKVPIDPPSLLVQRGQIKEARGLLYRTYGLDPPEGGAAADLHDRKVARLEMQINELVEASTTAKAIPRIHIHQAICDPFLRCALFLGFGLAAFQQLSGINALMSYSNSLFREAGIPPQYLTLASTIMGAVNVLVSVMSSKVVDHWGRRTLLLVGSFLQAVTMGVMTFSAEGLSPSLTGLIAVTSFSLFVVSFSAGLGAITWLYLAEIYPMEIRGSALSVCGVINWLSSFAVVFGTRFLDVNSACSLFGIICGVGFVGVYLWVVETKGCSMDDSPLTPRSARSSSTLLTPNSPKTAFHKMGGVGEEDEDGEEVSMTIGVR